MNRNPLSQNKRQDEKSGSGDIRARVRRSGPWGIGVPGPAVTRIQHHAAVTCEQRFTKLCF